MEQKLKVWLWARLFCCVSPSVYSTGSSPIGLFLNKKNSGVWCSSGSGHRPCYGTQWISHHFILLPAASALIKRRLSLRTGGQVILSERTLSFVEMPFLKSSGASGCLLETTWWCVHRGCFKTAIKQRFHFNFHNAGTRRCVLVVAFYGNVSANTAYGL